MVAESLDAAEQEVLTLCFGSVDDSLGFAEEEDLGPYFAIFREKVLMWFGAAGSPDEAMLGMLESMFFNAINDLGEGHSGIVAAVDGELGRLSDYDIYQCLVGFDQLIGTSDPALFETIASYDVLAPHLVRYACPYEENP